MCSISNLVPLVHSNNTCVQYQSGYATCMYSWYGDIYCNMEVETPVGLCPRIHLHTKLKLNIREHASSTASTYSNLRSNM